MENTFSVVQSFSKERFMQEVQLFPVLYNKFDAEFKNIDMKKNAWINIAEVFKITPVEAAEKYRSIRTTYGRYLKKKRLTPSGSGRSAVKHEYDYLEWLNIYIEHRETVSNLPVESIMSPQSQQQDQVFSSKTFQDSDASMQTCFPSKAPMQFGKFHSFSNSSASVFHSLKLLGGFK